MRTVDDKVRYAIGKLQDELLATLEGLPHLLYALLLSAVSCLGGFLRDGRGTGRVLSLQLLTCLGNGSRGGNPAYSPTRHSVCLAYAVGDDDALTQICKLCKTMVLSSVENDMFVYLI